MSISLKNYKAFFVSFALLFIVSCSTTSVEDEGYKGVYSPGKKSAERSLEVPPDLSVPDSSNALGIPKLSESSYSLYSSGDSQEDTQGSVLPKSSANVRFVRDGSVFWLEIKDNPDEIWAQVRNFFQDLGFAFVRENPVYGVIETNWLENRFDVPTGWFSSLLGGLFSTGLMDKYRIRIEHGEKEGTSLMFITHQGLKELSYGSFSDTDVSVKWVPREANPELEAEMLQRFLVFRGVKKAHAKQIAHKTQTEVRAKLVEDKSDKSHRVEVAEIFPRTWRRISIALDRIGLIVEDRNRSKGLYYIKTTEDFLEGEQSDQSWLASIFSTSDSQFKVAAYQLSVDAIDNKTVISVLNNNGDKDTSKEGYFILKKLTDHLR